MTTDTMEAPGLLPQVMEGSVFLSSLICSIQESIQKYDLACIKLPAVFMREISKKQLSGRDEGQLSLEQRVGRVEAVHLLSGPSPHLLLCSISWRTTMLRILCSLASGQVGLNGGPQPEDWVK